MSLVNLGRFALFDEFMLSACSRKELECKTKANLICFMYKLNTSRKPSEDLSTRFHHDAAETLGDFRFFSGR